MGQAGTDLIVSLQQVARAITAVGQTVWRPWWEIWGPPFLSLGITALGWWVVVKSNQRNNQHLMRLQDEELARGRILDALDGYLSFLGDAEDPSMILWRDRALLEQQLTAEAYASKGMEASAPNRTAGKLAFASVVFSDSRESRWIGVLHREAWTYKMHQDITDQVTTLESCHKEIMTALIGFVREQVSADRKDGVTKSSLLNCERDVESVGAIARQRKRVDSLYEAVSNLDSSRHVTIRR
jgi:hypothetical protein